MGSQYHLPRWRPGFSMVFRDFALCIDVYFYRYDADSTQPVIDFSVFSEPQRFGKYSPSIGMTHKYNKHIHKNKTRKNAPTGWIHITISGTPYDRGYQHGKRLAHLFPRIKPILAFIIKEELDISYKNYEKTTTKVVKPQIKRLYPECFEEMRGIAKGSNTSIDFIIAWNSILSMYSYYKQARIPQRCSAFIACGQYTKNGDIVMAHNTHSDYATAPLGNIILTIVPEKGHTIKMQTYPGFIASGTDWFLTTAGIMGCETTISKTNYVAKFGAPYFCRIRHAMQYANTLDEYTQSLLHNNAGDYACSWLLGNTHNNTIMLCEIGLNYQHIEQTNDGVYYGANSVMDPAFRAAETTDQSHEDLETSPGARTMRLQALLEDHYRGKIDLTTAKAILSDHYDVYTSTPHSANARTICKHGETAESPKPYGCSDGKVVNSAMAKKMEFWARAGSSCGRKFDAKRFIRENPKYAHWEKVLVDIKSYRWIRC